MKKTLLLTALLISSTSYANMYVKGGMSLTPSTNTMIDKGRSIISMDADQVKFDDQGVGFKLGLGYYISDSVSFELDLEKDGISMSYGLGMNVRLYNTDKFNFYTTLGFGKVMYDDDILSNPKDTTTTYYDYRMEDSVMKFSLGFGVEYDINENYSVYTTLEHVEYGELNVEYDITNTPTGDLYLQVSPNTKMEVGVKYKF